jgi:transposase-like protein
MDQQSASTLITAGPTSGVPSVALTDGYRESVESWADLLRDCKRRGMRAPVLAAGDGALGFWGALREVFTDTREQRCWFHKIANVLVALPKSAHPGAKKAVAGAP